MHLGELYRVILLCISLTSGAVIPVDSAFPGNYSDQDLSPDGLSNPSPSHVRTISAYEVCLVSLAY
jgi:hypothetical protein